jgi:Ring finger domain
MKKSNTAALYFCIIATVVGFVLLVETHAGKSAMSYLPNLFTRDRWNERTVRDLLQHQREWAFQLGRRHVTEQQERRQRWRRRRMEWSSTPQNVVVDPLAEVGVDPEDEELELWECPKKRRTHKLTSLVLSTATYQGASAVPPSLEDDQEENVNEHEVECSICLVPLETGDRIGNLPCRHQMHVDCLKSWLQRQNACPLCKRLKVAQPRYTDKNDEPTRGKTGDSSNTRSIEVWSSTNDLMQESDDGVDSFQGPETLPREGQVEDEPSNQQLEGTIVPRHSHEIPPLELVEDRELDDRLVTSL